MSADGWAEERGMFIADRDYRSALELVAEVSRIATEQATTTHQFAALLLPAVSALIGTDEISYVELRPVTYDVRYMTAYPTPPAAVPVAARTYVDRPAEHPWASKWHHRGREGAIRLSDLYTPAALSRLPYYADFYRPRGVFFGDYLLLRHDARRLVCLALGRRSRDFTDPEHDVLELLRRPLGAVAGSVHHAARPGRSSPSRPVVTLTAAERRVVSLLRLGRRNHEIAATIGVSTKAVEQHLTHIYRKVGVRSRVDLLRWLSPDERPDL